jgi:hypothetical protein
MADSPTSSTKRLSHYSLRKKLGAGAMGEVWLAHDKLLDRDVAIKLLHAGVTNQALMNSFLREARAAAKLNHPNTVTIYQIGKSGDDVFIAMEYVEAGSLADELQTKGALPWREATQAIRDAAAGLQAAHEMGLIHRDIKPSNLMRTARGLVKVADFGLAKAADGQSEITQTQPGMLLGSPAYMSPEQCRGERADSRSDLYSLICTYYQLLTRQIPFAAAEATAAMYQHCHEPFPDPRGKGFKVPDSVCRILIKGAQKKPQERYQTAAELLADLDVVLHTPEVSHTYDDKHPADEKRPASESKSKPVGAGISFKSILRGKGVTGKTSWALAVVAVAWGLFVILGRPGPGAQHAGLDKGKAGSRIPDNANEKLAAKLQNLPAVAPAASRVVDVLKLVDTDRDRLVGQWKRAGASLVSGNLSLIQVPYHPPAEYDFNVVFSPGNTAGHGMCLILSKGPRLFLFTISAGAYWDAFSLVRGKNGDQLDNPTRVPSAVRPAMGRQYTISVQVRNGRVEGFLDGKPVTSYKTDYSDLSNFSLFDKVQPGTLALASWDAPATIYSAQVVEVTGSGAVSNGNRVVDLMPLLDTTRDKVLGDWQLNAGTLSTAGADSARLQIPFTPPAEYEWTVVAERTEETGHGLVLGFVAGGNQSTLIMDGFGRTASGLETLDGAKGNANPTTYRQRILPAHQSVTIVLKVLKDRVIATYDGKTFVDWTGDINRLGVNDRWKVPNANQLFIGAQAPFRITKMSIVPQRGALPAQPAGHTDADGHRVVDLMPLINATADAVRGTWHWEGGMLQVAPMVRTGLSLALPYVPSDSEEYDLHVGFAFRNEHSEVQGLVSHSGKRFNFMLAQDGSYGFENVAGKGARDNKTSVHVSQLTLGSHDFVVRVRNKSVEAVLDGKQVIQYPTDYSDLDEADAWRRPDNALGIGSYQGDVEFRTIEVKEISGRGTARDPSAARPPTYMDGIGHRIVDLMPLIDPKADALKGVWHRVGDKLHVDPLAQPAETLLRLPYLPENSEVYDLHVGFVFRHGVGVVRGLVSHKGKRFGIMVDHRGNCGLEDIAGVGNRVGSNSTPDGPSSGGDIQHELVIRVRRWTNDAVEACLDGKQVILYSGGYDKLSENENWKRPDDALGIGAAMGDVDFGPIEVVEVEGGGTLLRTAISTSTPPPTGEDPHRQTPGLMRAFTTAARLQSAQVTSGGRRLCFCTTQIDPHYGGVLDVETGREIRCAPVNFSQFLPDAKHFVVDWGGWWKICDLETGKDLTDLGQQTFGNGTVSTDGSRLLTFPPNRVDNAILYDLNSGAKICELPNHAALSPWVLSPGGKTYSARTEDHVLHMWDAVTGNELWHIATDRTDAPLAFSTDGKLLLRRSRDKGVAAELYNAQTGGLLAECGGWSGYSSDAALSPDGKFLVAGCDDPDAGLRLFKLDGDEKKLRSTLLDWPTGAKEIGPVDSAAFSPDSRRVLVGCRNHKVRMYDVYTGHESANFDHGGDVLLVGFASDGRYAVSGNDTSVRVWRLP